MSALNPLLEIFFFGLGMDLLMLGISAVVAAAWTTDKKDFAVSFVVIYLITFLLGVSSQIWLLIVIAILVGRYVIEK